MTTDTPYSLHLRPRYPDGWAKRTATLPRGFAPASGDQLPRPTARARAKLATLGVGLAVFVAACHSGQDTGSQTASQTSPTRPGTPGGGALSAKMDLARIQGDSSAHVWFVIASDFQCPYCKQFHDQSFAALRQQYVATGKIRMAYVNFPLPIHPNAWPAAEAAMCAGAQGKFWEMHDALFESQDRWAEKPHANPVLDSLASSIGVDTVSMNACMGSQTVHALIDADHDRAEQSGVNATPTIIIGKKLLPGVEPMDNYRRVLDSALAASR